MFNKLQSFYKNSTQKHRLYLILGLLAAGFAMLPYLILGEGSIITYHDQLDGELLSYILRAKYLFSGVCVYPELMNGIPANGMVPPAPLFVLFYKVLTPWRAFLFSQWIIDLVAFFGMYQLLRKQTGHETVSFLCALIFMLLPFYPVYGLCIPGLPLVFSAVSEIDRGDRASVLRGLVFLILYGLASSLVLIGFAVLLALGLWGMTRIPAAVLQKKVRPVIAPWGGMLVLLCIYLCTNTALIRQVLFPASGYISHKAEMKIFGQDVSGSFLQVLKSGMDYAMTYHQLLLPLIAAGVLLYFFLQKKQRLTDDSKTLEDCLSMKKYRAIPILSLQILVIVAFQSLYLGEPIAQLRNSAGGIVKEWNMARVGWLLPLMWLLLIAYVCSMICDLAARNRLRFIASRLILLLCLTAWMGTVLLHSPLRPNISKLIKGNDYYALDWNSFFAPDIFGQINEAIDLPQEDYRVVSIGIYPAAAAYNGFYCLDGYSNNYPLEYKHEFRKIMEGELKKSDYVRDFFDNWGNRCYITTAEQANYYTFEKKWNSVIYDLDLNTDQLRSMNCRYLFSAAYLMNAEELGLRLLREEPFETEGSWYHLYVYEIP